jgi:glycosyltransferase 2 family protein
VTRPTGWGVARVAVAAGLTGYLLWASEPRAVLAAAAGAAVWPIAAALLLVLVDRTLMAWRWLLLLAPVPGARPPLRVIIRIFFVSTFVGTFLPASIGGDAVRAYGLSRAGVGLADAAASVFMDRVLGVLAIILLGAFALAALPGIGRTWEVAGALGAAAAACAGVGVVVFSDAGARRVAGLLERVPGRRLRKAGVQLLASVQRYATARRILLLVLAASVGVQVLRVLQAWLLGLALGIMLGPAPYFAYIPLILLVMLLPITVNGLGTSQAAFIWLFARSGVGEAPAFALSVLFLALGVVGNLPGGLLYATGGLEDR